LPGGTGLHRQAVHPMNPENINTGMRHLATMNSPPGSFWNFPETRKK